ncbi:Ulp1 family isopeptidase [Legionella lytica]|uniref:Ulp1 family isopeptidase n=1 Tax=Legionella lytica TaxID=96232 RepID=A0ABW8D4S4_9GAMM
MTKRDREYVNAYDDENDELLFGQSHRKTIRSEYTYDPSSRRNIPIAIAEIIADNPFHQFQKRVYALLEKKRKNRLFSDDVDALFYSFKTAADHFEDWIEHRKCIDKDREVINKIISFLFNDLGLLAVFTNVALPVDKLVLILSKIEHSSLNTPTNIIRALFGLRAIINKHQDRIPTTLVENLLSMLLQCEHISDQELSNCITVLGTLCDYVDKPIKTEAIHQLLRKIITPNSSHNATITRAIHLLGRIARMRMYTAPLDASLIQPIIEEFYRLPDLDETKHHKTLEGLEWIVNKKLLSGRLDTPIIIDLLAYGLHHNNGHLLNSSLSILYQLVRDDRLRGTVDFSPVINALNKRKPNIQHVSELLYISGLLAQKGHLQKVLDVHLVQTLIDTLPKLICFSDTQASDSFSGLALLAQTQYVNINQIKQIHYNLTSLLQELSLHRIDPINAEKILFGLVELRTQLRCHPEQLQKILHSALGTKNPLHPHAVIKYIDWFAKLGHLYPAESLNNGFGALLASINFQAKALNTADREQFKRAILSLKSNPNWTEALDNKLGISTVQKRPLTGPQDTNVVMRESNSTQPTELPAQNIQPTHPVRIAPVSRMPGETSEPRQPLVRPTPDPTTQTRRTTSRSLTVRPLVTRTSPISSNPEHPESWNAAYRNNDLFKAIADRNMHQLSILLGVNAEIPTHAYTFSGSSSSRNNNSHRWTQAPTQNKEQQAANVAVTQLLQTETNALRILISHATASYFEVLLRACSNHTRYQLAQRNALNPILRYLPMQELERYIPNLLSLEFYRDSTALTKLVRALKTRAAEHPEELEQIKQLQIQLLDRALEFHECLFHTNVLRMLRTEKVLVLRMNANTNQPLQQVHPTQPPMQRVETQRPSTQAPQRLFAPQSLVINPRYHYETEDMNRILRLRLRHLNLSEEDTPNLSILSAADMGTGSQGNRVIDVLSQYLAGAEGQLVINSQAEQNIIIPIVHNHHWVGIRIQLGHGHSPQITYYNTVNHYEYDDELQVSILLEVNRAIRNRTSWTNPSITMHDRTLIQDDASSCGPLLIESIYCHLTNRSWQQTSNPELLAAKTRRLQLKLLETKDPQFYQLFYAQQSEQTETSTRMNLA